MRRSCCVAATGANCCQFQCFDRVVKCPLRSGKNGPLPGCVVPAVFQRNTVDVHIPSQRQVLVVQKYRNQWMSHRSRTHRISTTISIVENTQFSFHLLVFLYMHSYPAWSWGKTEQHVFRSTNETRFDGPCQGTGGNFGFQEAATEVAAPINCRSTPYTYCCEFGVPRDSSPGSAPKVFRKASCCLVSSTML